MPSTTSGPARALAGGARARRRAVRRRRRGPSLLALTLTLVTVAVVLASGARTIQDLRPPVESGPDDIRGIPAAASVEWDTGQPGYGVDISFPQCGRVLRDLADGFVIVGLDGGMPDRPNRCFAEQWRFAQRQSGAAVYVNTADNGRGDPVDVGRRAALARPSVTPMTMLS